MLKEQKGPSSNYTVPILKADPKLKNRINILTSHFTSYFHLNPTFYVCVPGRVNLIGEHVDYCGYSVCPMAIEQNILVAVRKSDENGLKLINVDDNYPDYQHNNLENIRDLQLDGDDIGPIWYKYFLCGVKGVLGVIPKENIPKGFLAAVSGNIPPNAGLSSSSALVSAALLATVHVSQHIMTRKDMATVSANAERYIGTQGGGMDQAIAFLGKAGSAKLIEFNPLRAFDIKLPNNAVFVIAHSLVDHNKASTRHFNIRVLECKLAAQVIAKKNNIDWRNIQKLIDVQEHLSKSLEQMANIVMENLHEEPYTIEEICDILEITVDQFKRTSNVLENTTQKLKLRQRAFHVFKEAARVMAFKNVCEYKNMDASTKLYQLGNLMSKSHLSLQKFYECSHPRIDSLVNAAMECGAFGARLTGAGWGGFIIAITTEEKVKEFIQKLKEKFYIDDPQSINKDLSKIVFQTEPKAGAVIYSID